jgi:3-oxoacyl-ACP reductase-like protein
MVAAQTEGATMSIFASILSKLGFGSAKPAAPAPAPAAAPAPQAAPAPAAAAAPAAIGLVDVVGQLEALAAKSAEKLNWRVSIVDLMKLLGLDSSFGVRKQLAAELGCPPDKMGDSAQMNMWLHQTVLQKLAANGGNVPKDLLP